MLAKSPMDRLTGILLIGLLVALVASIVLTTGIDTDEKSFEASLREIIEKKALFELGTVSRLAYALLSLLAAGALYGSFRSHNRFLALVGALGVLASGLARFVAVVAAWALREMALAYETASGAQAEMIATSARPLALLAESASQVGVGTFLPVCLLALGALIAWSRALPRWLGILGIVSGILALGLLLSELVVGFWLAGLAGLAGAMGALLWLLLVGVWLLLRGTRAPAREDLLAKE